MRMIEPNGQNKGPLILQAPPYALTASAILRKAAQPADFAA